MFSCDVSFHEEYVDIDSFINKFSELRNLAPNYKWKVLSVVTNKNIDIQKQLFKSCISANIDICLNQERSSIDEGKTIILTDEKGIELIKRSEKLKSFTGLLVEYSDGIIKKYKSRRELANDLDIDPFGWYCNINRKMIFIYPDLSVKFAFCTNKSIIHLRDLIIENNEQISCEKHFCSWCFPCKVINGEY